LIDEELFIWPHGEFLLDVHALSLTKMNVLSVS